MNAGKNNESADIIQLKEYVDLKLVPIEEKLNRHEKSLFGLKGTNGINRTVTVLSWVSGWLVIVLGWLIKKM